MKFFHCWGCGEISETMDGEHTMCVTSMSDGFCEECVKKVFKFWRARNPDLIWEALTDEDKTKQTHEENKGSWYANETMG